MAMKAGIGILAHLSNENYPTSFKNEVGSATRGAPDRWVERDPSVEMGCGNPPWPPNSMKAQLDDSIASARTVEHGLPNPRAFAHEVNRPRGNTIGILPYPAPAPK